MQTTDPHQLPHGAHADPHAGVGHELRDAKIRPLIEAGIVLFVICVVTFAGMIPLHNLLKGFEEQKEGSLTPLEAERVVPVSTLLETSPNIPRSFGDVGVEVFKTTGLANFRAEENARLTSYGWIDEQAKIVHVPVEVAMQALLQKGFPSRK